jgi:hypothetical protein
MDRPNSSVIEAREQEKDRMAALLSEPPHQQERNSVETKGEVKTKVPEVVIVKIPFRFTEDKVKTLMGSMEAQFEGTGYKVVFAPEEVGIHLLN